MNRRKIKKTALGAGLLLGLTVSVTGCQKGIEFDSKELAAGKVGEAYNDSIAGEAELYYELDYDAELPEGLFLEDDGRISGIPSKAGSVTFKAVASNDEDYKEADFTIEIEKGTLVYETKELNSARTGEPYVAAVAAASGAEEITYELKEGSVLPEGLEMSETGEISGTAETVGEYSFTVAASAQDCDPAEAEFQICVEEGKADITDLGYIVFEGWELPEAEVGAEYNESVRNAYGVEGIQYEIKYVNGVAFPKGLSFNEEGFITGTPETSTSGTMKFQVIASAEGVESVSVECTLKVKDVFEETSQFEGEYVDVSKLQGAGYSSSPSGKGMIQQFAKASNTHALGYLHKAIQVDFVFESDTESEGQLVLGLGTEVGTIEYNTDKFKVYVNGEELDYGSFTIEEKGTGQETEFQEFALSPNIKIKEGENMITLEVMELQKNTGIGTSTAKGPIVDYVRIDNTDAVLGYRPVVANVG